MLAHLTNIEPLIEQLLGMSELVRIDIMGPTDELTKLKDPLNKVSKGVATFFNIKSGHGCNIEGKGGAPITVRPNFRMR